MIESTARCMGRPPAKTALAPDLVRPTEHQVKVGVIVVPKAFIDANRQISWHSFQVFLCDRDLGFRHLDQDNRLRLPLRVIMKFGESLRLEVRDRALRINVGATNRAESE